MDRGARGFGNYGFSENARRVSFFFSDFDDGGSVLYAKFQIMWLGLMHFFEFGGFRLAFERGRTGSRGAERDGMELRPTTLAMRSSLNKVV